VRHTDPYADDYRLEVRVSAALHEQVPRPRLRFSGEMSGWVILVFDVAPGRHPIQPWTPRALKTMLHLVGQLAQELTPAPLADVPTVADRMSERALTWGLLAGGGSRDDVKVEALDAWELAHLDRLAAAEDSWEAGAVGDSLLLESDLGALDAESLFLGTRSGDLADPSSGDLADPSSIDGFLVALASYWIHSGAHRPQPDERRLQELQSASGRATLGWLRPRWS